MHEFSVKELQDFVSNVLKLEGEEKTSDKANEVYTILLKLLEEKGHITPHAPQAFVDILLAGALLHDLVWKEGDCWTNVFYARKNWEDIAINVGLTEPTRNALFSVIESQLGDRVPVDGMKIKPGTPNELFYYAVWFSNYLEGRV